MNPRSLILIFCLLYYGSSQSQEIFDIRTIAFYNLENLFDTVNDTTHFDDDRTPGGSAGWTQKRYTRKLRSLSIVIAELGASRRGKAPDILGVCEVENQQVLQDLIRQPLLKGANYAFVHSDSPDERGIDVALLYDQDHFIPTSYHLQEVRLFDDRMRSDATRDQLVVVGYLDGEEMGFIVNHWPSRRGGSQKSEVNRLAAARVTRKLVDSLRNEHPGMPLIIMGDFNDNPTNKSIKQVLQSRGDMDSLSTYQLFNPMEKLFAKGYGTIGYRDRWSLFDQILLNTHASNTIVSGYQFWKAGIFTPYYLVQASGRYKGYPKSTYVAGRYKGGYSDHFPVFIHLVRQAD